MAKRVSGHVSVRLSFDGTRDAYVCRVSNTQGEGAPIRVICGISQGPRGRRGFPGIVRQCGPRGYQLRRCARVRDV